jgi:hypothetical protein
VGLGFDALPTCIVEQDFRVDLHFFIAGRFKLAVHCGDLPKTAQTRVQLGGVEQRLMAQICLQGAVHCYGAGARRLGGPGHGKPFGQILHRDGEVGGQILQMLAGSVGGNPNAIAIWVGNAQGRIGKTAAPLVAHPYIQGIGQMTALDGLQYEPDTFLLVAAQVQGTGLPLSNIFNGKPQVSKLERGAERQPEIGMTVIFDRLLFCMGQEPGCQSAIQGIYADKKHFPGQVVEQIDLKGGLDEPNLQSGHRNADPFPCVLEKTGGLVAFGKKDDVANFTGGGKFFFQ